MTLRNRTRTAFQSGDRNGVVKIRQTLDEFFQDVPDNPGRDHICSHVKTTIDGSISNGYVRSGIFTDYPSSLTVSNYAFSGLTFSETNHSVYSRMLAASAPGRASVNVPVFLAELRDIPSLIKWGHDAIQYLRTFSKLRKDGRWVRVPRIKPATLVDRLSRATGRNILRSKRLAQASLMIQFGVLPLISDVNSMANIMRQIELRRNEVRKFRENGSVTRRWSSAGFEERPIFTEFRILQSQGSVGATITVHETLRRWATVKWVKGRNTSLPETDADIIRTVLGLTPQSLITGGWELVRWSWLVDYFSNVGQVLSVFANGIQYDCYGSVMTEQRLTAKHPGNIVRDLPLTEISLSAGALERTFFNRDIYSGAPGLSVFEDILSPKQLSILGSLATVKGLAK